MIIGKLFDDLYESHNKTTITRELYQHMTSNERVLIHSFGYLHSSFHLISRNVAHAVDHNRLTLHQIIDKDSYILEIEDLEKDSDKYYLFTKK